MAAANLSDRLQLGLGVYHAGRVGRRVQHEHLGLVGDGGVQLLCGDLEVRLLGCGYDDRDCTCLLYHLGVAYPVRSRDNDLIARVAQRHQRDIDRVLCTRSHNDLRRLVVQTAVLLQTVASCLAQVHQTGCRRVLGLVVLNGLDTGLLDVLRRRKIRLTAPKPTTSLPSAFICLNSESMASVVDACTPAAILEIGFNAMLSTPLYLSSVIMCFYYMPANLFLQVLT